MFEEKIPEIVKTHFSFEYMKSHFLLLLGMGYTNVCYFLLAVLFYFPMALIFGRYFNEDQERKKKTYVLVLELLVNAWIAGVMAYIARHLFNLLPFTIGQNTKYKDWIVREVTTGGLFMTYLLSFDIKFKGQVNILTQRLQKSTPVLPKKKYT